MSTSNINQSVNNWANALGGLGAAGSGAGYGYQSVNQYPATTNVPKRNFNSMKVARSPYYKAYMEEDVKVKTRSNKDRASIWSVLKPYLIATKGMRQGAPTPVAHALLLGTTPKGVSNTFVGNIPEIDILKHLGLLLYIPAIPEKKRGYYRTYAPGIQLLQFWCEVQPGFQRFYDAFVTRQGEEDAMKWAVEYSTDFTPTIIAEREKEIAAYNERVAQQMVNMTNAYSNYINTNPTTTMLKPLPVGRTTQFPSSGSLSVTNGPITSSASWTGLSEDGSS